MHHGERLLSQDQSERRDLTHARRQLDWGVEIDLDIDMVSAACPDCKIVLVEANSSAYSDLLAAEAAAVSAGASYVSNSWGGGEYNGEQTNDASSFSHAGVSFFASTGDGGYGVEYPSASFYVTAVGGTSLSTASNARGWTETAWAGSGSGCSAYISKPSWQKDTGCSNRTVADVSAVADPGNRSRGCMTPMGAGGGS